MKARKSYLVVLAGLVIVGLAAALPAKKASAHGDEGQFIAASSLLAGLAPGAAFPFIDTTPHGARERLLMFSLAARSDSTFWH
jgi:hypothetical protein